MSTRPIALVTHRYAPAIGGVERVVEQLARGLARRGIAVEVITTDPTRQLPLRLGNEPISPIEPRLELSIADEVRIARARALRFQQCAAREAVKLDPADFIHGPRRSTRYLSLERRSPLRHRLVRRTPSTGPCRVCGHNSDGRGRRRAPNLHRG